MSENVVVSKDVLQQALAWIHYHRRAYAIDEPIEERNLRSALAQQEQEQEPVAWVDEASIAWLAEHPRGIITTRLVKQKSPERQMAMYAEPPRREWRSLTNEEIYPLYNEPRSDAEILEFARAIEAKLKEKNHV